MPVKIKYRPTLLVTGVMNEIIYDFKIHAFIILNRDVQAKGR